MTAPLPVKFGTDGLIPTVIQESSSGQVLMVGFMNEAALATTRATGRVHFWSRSRGKLWRKGETSGHEQIVESIAINCELSSLLIHVRQLGAVCHDGYTTCFYRRLEPDNSLTTLYDRVFDPETVYGDSPLSTATEQLFGAYVYLAANDLTAVSSTSRRLRAQEDAVTSRVGDELRELAGVLDGTHQHGTFTDDISLEATQVIYWVILAAVRAGQTWDTLRPDQALTATNPPVDRPALTQMLRAEAEHWQEGKAQEDASVRYRAVLQLISAVCRSAGIPPLVLIDADLAELREKSYMAPYFATPSGYKFPVQ